MVLWRRLPSVRPKRNNDQDFVVDLLDAATKSSIEVITELRDINSIRFVDPSKWWPKFDGMTQRVSSQLLSNGGTGAPGGCVGGGPMGAFFGGAA